VRTYCSTGWVEGGKNGQPRSGERMQPTAQAVGKHLENGQAPEGRKKSFDLISKLLPPTGRGTALLTEERA